ncbi:alpha/beta fold hydrolase [Erythrobacter arachoides]|uniref:Alpha/beta fold hydrolase n=1 Tax=Aurantiacibacter arachoides TaxID=1850444 RepID=A0A845A878_9SPHN|nr:alpha/beta hydrolase [Aurantiacibacter arachoides]MXO93739.1 alpha/beta fold hydrolase [Aurantiacibacter arachoides]GGD46999.1 alpha/beta hydrolase [Aurantiacibacter arachoides]
MGEPAFTTGTWQSDDGLTLHYRDYPAVAGEGREDRPALLCIPGLTRNARDFEPLAHAFAGEWRLVCVDLRGRGESEYAKDSATYAPLQYAADVAALFDQAGLGRVVAVGTSLGGIVTALLAAQDASRFAAVVLNDIGPDIEAAGLERIRDYVGQGRSFPTWVHAARAMQEANGDVYPDYVMADWLRMAKRTMALGGGGRIAFDYDMRIAEPFSAPPPAEPVDMWPVFGALGGRPVLSLRGERSDLLSAATQARMVAEIPGCTAVVVPGVGHVPTFEEPVAQAAVANLLAQVA